MKEQLTSVTWGLGVRAFRLSRRLNISATLEPVFWKLAGLVPWTTSELSATLPLGGTLSMPPGYRDARTVMAGLFQSDETRLFSRLISPGMTIVDVGAYVGYFTLVASALVGPTGHVYAFEPDELAYRYLLRNIATNECPNVHVCNKAVSDSDSNAILVRDPLGPESYLVHTEQGGGTAVATVTLDSFMESTHWPRVDVVKMNIEGAEMVALKGMRGLSQRNPQLQLIMEFNPTALARAGVERDRLSNMLSELGFRRGQIVERGLEVAPPGELLPRGRTVYNVLLTK